MVRARLVEVRPPSGGLRLLCAHTPPTSPSQDAGEHVQAREAARDQEPVGILCQPAVAHVGKAEDPLDHQKDMFDLGADLGFRPVLRPLVLAQRLAAILTSCKRWPVSHDKTISMSC
jgi:hypothetical protein